MVLRFPEPDAVRTSPMATTTHRTRADGSTAVRITWRQGGSREGRQQSETFDDPTRAEQFRAAVELAGQHWPPGWTPGVGWTPVPPPAAVTPVAPPTPLATVCEPEMTMLDFGMVHIRDRVGPRPDTRHDYELMLRQMCTELTPIVGGVPTVQNIKEEHVARWVNFRRTQPTGSSSKTIKNRHGLLAAILKTAVRRGLRPDNPCEGHRLPGWDSDDVEPAERALAVEEFALIAHCMLPDAMYRAGIPGTAPGGRTLSREAKGVHAGTITDRRLIEVAAGTGLRWGEVTALKPRLLELDVAQPFAWVHWAWKANTPAVSEFHDPSKDALYLGSPKSKRSRRRAHLSPAVVEVLRAACDGKDPDALIFTAPRGGKLRQATWYEDRWSPALDLAVQRGLTGRPRFHDLRHTNAEWQRVAGVDERAIQVHLGHSSIVTTGRYGGHGTPSYETLDAAIDAALLPPLKRTG
jgi:integrase